MFCIKTKWLHYSAFYLVSWVARGDLIISSFHQNYDVWRRKKSNEMKVVNALYITDNKKKLFTQIIKLTPFDNSCWFMMWSFATCTTWNEKKCDCWKTRAFIYLSISYLSVLVQFFRTFVALKVKTDVNNEANRA